MAKIEGLQHSILIVSGSESFDAFAKSALPERRFITIDVRRNAAAARRAVLERYYNIILICVPLPDETGLEFAQDLAETQSAGVLLVTPQDVSGEVQEQTVDEGVLVVPKPVTRGQLNRALRMLVSWQDRIAQMAREVAKAQEKTEEARIVGKAKCALVEKRHMTEDEAHRVIGKEAMDHGISRKRAAEWILDELE